MTAKVRNAGTETPQSVQSMWTTLRAIRKPTTTMAGATASKGTTFTSGVRNMAARNSTPVTTLARPVRAPSAIPVEDSTKIWFEDTEPVPPATAPSASTSSTRSTRSIRPFSSTRPACWDRPTMVPMASKKMESRIVKINRAHAITPS